MNQTAELRCVITNNVSWYAHSISVEIRLPESLELVNGSLSWTRDIPAKHQVTAINAIVKSIKVGNWAITISEDVNAPANRELGLANTEPIINHIYVSISENSAQWRTNPPYGVPTIPIGGPPETVKPSPTHTEPTSPIKVDLNISKLPILNEPVDLTCIVSATSDIPNTSVNIILPKGMEFISGNSEWQGDLKKGISNSFSAKVIFKETGKYSIEARAKHVIDNNNSIGGLGMLYIHVLDDHSEFGWRPAPPKIDQSNPGNEKYVIAPISDKIEDFTPGEKITLPAPFPVSPNDILDNSRKSSGKGDAKLLDANITVTGYWYYYTDLQHPDYRETPAPPWVPAKYFLVYLYDQNNNYKGQGYTDSNGYFSIPNVDPTNGLKARLWCYINYGVDELRVIYWGSTTTGLDDVWFSPYTTTYGWDPDGGVHSMGNCWIELNADGDGAFWIKDDMDRAYRFPGYAQGKCTARWTENNPEDTCADGDMIRLAGPVQKTPDIIVHEFAHVSMGHINPVTGYTPADPHEIWVAYDENNAWVEGWANFFPLMVNGNYIYTHATGQTVDFENTYPHPPYSGDTVEGWVAAALWDIYDSINDGYDLFSTSFANIWTTFCNTQGGYTRSFHEFWNKASSFNSNIYAFQALYQNTIDYGAKRLTASVNPPGTGVVYKIPDVYVYPTNYIVTLSAQPVSGYQFSYWNGAVANPNSYYTTITMDSDYTVIAQFVPIDTTPPTVTINQASGQSDPTSSSPVN